MIQLFESCPDEKIIEPKVDDFVLEETLRQLEGGETLTQLAVIWQLLIVQAYNSGRRLLPLILPTWSK